MPAQVPCNLVMDNQPKIRVRSAERVSRGLIITFDDGKSVLYSAALLRDAFSQAEELKETDRDDLGLRTVSEYRGRRNQPAKVPRLLVIGGAGSLEVPPGLTLVNTPDFPPEYEPQTLAGVEFLNVLRGEKELPR